MDRNFINICGGRQIKHHQTRNRNIQSLRACGLRPRGWGSRLTAHPPRRLEPRRRRTPSPPTAPPPRSPRRCCLRGFLVFLQPSDPKGRSFKLNSHSCAFTARQVNWNRPSRQRLVSGNCPFSLGLPPRPR
jgi:hypothetical protein